MSEQATWTTVPTDDGLLGAANTRMPRFARALAAVRGLLWGSGAPKNSIGDNGFFYFRSDGSAGSYVYVKSAGVWGAIL